MYQMKNWMGCLIGEMIVTVHLHTTLQQQTPDGPRRQVELNLPDGLALVDLIQRLDIEIDPDETLLIINGRMAELSQPVSDGDQVHLIPAISGG